LKKLNVSYLIIDLSTMNIEMNNGRSDFKP